MKSILKLTLGALALSLAQQAAADVTVRLTGSTAFRSGTHKAIVAMMGGETSCKFAHGMITGATTAATAAGYEAADYTTIQGTASGISGITTVQCSWTGSATGIKDVAEGNNLSFIPTSALPANTGYANAAVTQSPTQNATAKYAFSDVFQSSTATTTPALTDSIMAVIPFSWVANRLSTGFTNMTQQGARALFTNGFQPKSLFTGDAADTDYVLPVGRDIGSGTRITCLAEIKYGVNTPVQQWKIVSSGTVGAGTIVSARLWPVGDGIGSATPGNGGYTSGSTIRNFFGMTSTASGAYTGVTLLDQDGNNVSDGLNVTLVSWLGVSDVATAVTNGAVRLAYEGVTYDGSNKGLIYNGRYTAWGYLHCYTPSGLSADESTFKTNLSTQLDNESVIGASGLRSSQMAVSRTADGAVVGP